MVIESHRQIVRAKDGNKAFNDLVYPVSGQWALQNNEVNGWGLLGPYDNTNSQDLGNYTNYLSLNPQQLGGFRFPFDVDFIELDIIYRINNNNTQDWKWLIYTQEKTIASTTRSTELIYDGPLGIIATPTQYQQTTITAADLTLAYLPAGQFFCLAAGTPSQVANRNIQIYGGSIVFRKNEEGPPPPVFPI